jgi:hypothetical protein
MTVRVVGAGLGRTGTNSLKVALEQLLGGTCYHMAEVFGRPDDIATWQDAVDGRPVDWHALFRDFTAAVDWPVVGFWQDISAAYPDAIVLLSTRSSAQAWWKGADETIFAVMRRGVDYDGLMRDNMIMIRGLFERFTPGWDDPATAQRAYEEHNALVRATVPRERLVDWQPGDGWEPICAALGVPVPDSPFPHTNSKDEFRAMAGLD